MFSSKSSQTWPSTKKTNCLNIIQDTQVFTTNQCFVPNVNVLDFVEDSFWGMKKSEKALHFIHEATNTINTPLLLTAFVLAPDRKKLHSKEHLSILWGWEALWSGWRREPQVAEAAEFLSLSLSFQNLPNLFGSYITLIALIAILDKVWGLEDPLSMAAWFSRHTLEIPHIWWPFFLAVASFMKHSAVKQAPL